MNITHIHHIARILSLTCKRSIAFFKNIPIAIKRTGLKISISSDKAFLRDIEEDVERLTDESNSRHKHHSRQEYGRVFTTEIDSRMVKGMTELKELKQKIEDKEENLSNLSYK